MADAARRRVYEHALSFLKQSLIEDALPRGQCGKGHCGCRGDIDGMRRLGERGSVDYDKLGKRALPLADESVYMLISAPLHGVAADPHYFADEIPSQRERQRVFANRRIAAFARFYVDGIDA